MTSYQDVAGERDERKPVERIVGPRQSDAGAGVQEITRRFENSQEEAELEAIADAMDAYDTMARLAPLLK